MTADEIAALLAQKEELDRRGTARAALVTLRAVDRRRARGAAQDHRYAPRRRPSDGEAPLAHAMPRTLTDDDFARAAKELNVEVAAIRAVAEVEAAGAGFLPDGRPSVLFEAHVFHQHTKGAHAERQGPPGQVACRRRDGTARSMARPARRSTTGSRTPPS